MAAQERQLDDARDPDGVRELDGRGARQKDAAASLDGGALETGRANTQAVRLDGRARRHDLRAGAGIFSDRSLFLSVPAGPDQRRTDALWRQAAERTGARGSVLRRDPGSRHGVHVGRRNGAVQGRCAGEDAAQRGCAEPVRDRAGVRERQRGDRSSDDDDGNAASAPRRSSASRACCTRSRLQASTAPASTSIGR